ncbi:NAD(P)-binding protein [Auraticoccus monumenti]|uniref:Trk K+ transport system, NAD-binding component n=1 Tax=Auraticoccus monumenti TaxID=675864 RepID=A0A1G7B2I3_9ACTN|nr:NAD(P)-binding protein [Auraticoccus monumenti]SDE20476.1 Trk K+ transport system, NAD-binding component [Auraticoccus monumenti]
MTPDRHEDHVVVVGATSTAVRLAEELQKSGERVVALTRVGDDDHDDELAEAGARVLPVRRVGEAELREAGAPRARCVVVLGADDVNVIRVALMVEEMCPGVRLVLEMANPDLARRLEPLLGECVVLSAAEIAAPSIVAAALESSEVETFELAGRPVVAGARDRVGGELLAVLGDTTRVGTDALLPVDGDLVLGTEIIGRAGGSVRTTGLPGALRRTFDRRLRWVLLGLVALIAASAAYFRLNGVGWWQALYLALTTSTQTGVDVEVEALPLVARFGAVVIQLFGLTLSAGITAVVVDLLVTSRLAALTGGVRGKPRHHVVVCGLGRIGTSVMLRLHERRVAVVAVERDEDGLGVRRARQLKVPVVIAEGTDTAALEVAGIDRADVVLALTDDDAANLEIALVAKEVNPRVRVVTRLFDHALAARVERTMDLGPTRSVSVLAAPAFAAATLGRHSETIFPVGRRVLIFTELTITDELGGTLPPSVVERPGLVRLLAVQRPGGVWSWRPDDTPLSAGDRLAVAATRTGLAELLSRLHGADPVGRRSA